MAATAISDNAGELQARAKKHFIPIENNPEVMSALVHRLGLSNTLSFHDVFSIDDPDLLAFVPRPAYALLLVFPVSNTFDKFRTQEDADKQEYNGHGDEEEVIWYKQTIHNACGLMGLLHIVSNGQARAKINPGSDLAELLRRAIPLPPKARSELLEDSKALESAHHAAASTGDTSAPAAEDEIDLHYVAFIRSESGNLWELDGGRKGPLNRGHLDEGDDVLSEKALDLGIRSFLKREAEAGGGDLRFSLLVLAPSLE